MKNEEATKLLLDAKESEVCVNYGNRGCPCCSRFIEFVNIVVALLQKQPPEGEFTKTFRSVLADAEKIDCSPVHQHVLNFGREARIIIDQQAEDNKNQAAEIERFKREILAAGKLDFDWSVLERLDKLEEQKTEIERLKGNIKGVCNLIRNTGEVNKWKILNWLEEALKGKTNGR